MADRRGRYSRAAPPAPEQGSTGVVLLIGLCVLVIGLAGAGTYLVRQRFATGRQPDGGEPRSATTASTAPAPAAAPAVAQGEPAPIDVSQLYFGGREGRWWVSRLRELKEKKDDRLYQLTVKKAEANGLHVVDGPDGPYVEPGPALTAALRGATP